MTLLTIGCLIGLSIGINWDLKDDDTKIIVYIITTLFCLISTISFVIKLMEKYVNL